MPAKKKEVKKNIEVVEAEQTIKGIAQISIKYKGQFYQPGEELEIALEDKEELSAYVLYK